MMSCVRYILAHIVLRIPSGLTHRPLQDARAYTFPAWERPRTASALGAPRPGACAPFAPTLASKDLRPRDIGASGLRAMRLRIHSTRLECALRHAALGGRHLLAPLSVGSPHVTRVANGPATATRTFAPGHLPICGARR